LRDKPETSGREQKENAQERASLGRGKVAEGLPEDHEIFKLGKGVLGEEEFLEFEGTTHIEGFTRLVD
jgi:hypothetical protein